MATSPVSGALSPTQLAVLEQIRALRAVKPVQTAPAVQAPSSPPTQAKVAAPTAAADRPPAFRGRGSIVNIVA